MGVKRNMVLLVNSLSINLVFAQSNWNYQQSNTAQSLRSVYFTGQNTGWAGGFNGTILHPTNGGANWVAQTSGTTNKVYAVVYFIESNNGWVVGEFGTILHTSYGGVNWIAQTSGTMDLLGSIKFTNASTGFICGNNDTVIKTTDSDTNWLPQSSGTTSIYSSDGGNNNILFIKIFITRLSLKRNFQRENFLLRGEKNNA